MFLLDVKSVSVSYGDFKVLSEVSLGVENEELVSIVGANSAGKSTLVKTISGELEPDEGDITFEGTSIAGMESHRIARLGLVQVPEGRRIFPLLTVHENLLVASTIGTAKGQRAESLKKIFELLPVLKVRRNQFGGTLSGGEQQMLAIARGLMAVPKLLILDEPSVGLAPFVLNLIYDVVQQVNQEGLPVLLVEQNVKKSLSLARRAYVLENGRMTMEGAGDQLLSHSHIREAYLGI